MSDGSKIVGLGTPETGAAPDRAEQGETKPASPSGGLLGLGTPKPQAGAAPSGGLLGLGAPKPQAGTAPTGGLLGLGTPKPQAGTAPTGGGLLGLGGGKPLGAQNGAAAAPAAPKAKAGIRIDVSAADRIKTLLEKRGTLDAGLRIRVRGGGCTGLQYDMEFADQARDKDRVFEEHGVRIFVDPKSYIFLIGTTLSYQSGLLESGFKLENPNVKKSCGCGDSFSI